MKIKYKHILVAIMIFFSIIVLISVVSACLTPPEPKFSLDEGHKTFNYKNYKVYTSWSAYRYSKGKNDPIMVYNEYELKNKKTKKIFSTDVYFDIEKIKKIE